MWLVVGEAGAGAETCLADWWPELLAPSASPLIGAQTNCLTLFGSDCGPTAVTTVGPGHFPSALTFLNADAAARLPFFLLPLGQGMLIFQTSNARFPV